MEVVKARAGFAVVAGDGVTRLFEGTKKACEAWKTDTEQILAQVQAAERADQERTEARMRALGLERVDYRDIQVGDVYTHDPASAPRMVTRVHHFDNGASVIHHDNHPLPDSGLRCILHTGDSPAYRQVLRCRHCGERVRRRTSLWWHVDGKTAWVVCPRGDTRATPRWPALPNTSPEQKGQDR